MLFEPRTDHRLGIQAFEPVLIDGASLAPTCSEAYNADSLTKSNGHHVPPEEAQAESRTLMLAAEHIFEPERW